MDAALQLIRDKDAVVRIVLGEMAECVAKAALSWMFAVECAERDRDHALQNFADVGVTLESRVLFQVREVLDALEAVQTALEEPEAPDNAPG